MKFLNINKKTHNDMINAIIVDDEPIARRGMKRLVESRPEINLLAAFPNAEEAEEFLKENDVDLIFLDIEMPGANGIEFASRIPEKCMVVFTTAYSEYALDSYNVDALDYLVKPIDPTRFDKAVDKAVSYHALLASASSEEAQPVAEKDFIIVKSNRRYLRIHLSDINFIEGLKDYIVIHLPDKKIITRLTIKSIEETLPSYFLRVNKSYIVNRDKIDSFDNKDVVIGTVEIAIGASWRDDVLDTLLNP